MLKNLLKASFQRIGIYYKLKFSFLYDIYWGLVDPEVIAERDKEVEFYRDTLRGMRTGDLVFDIGANLGYKSDIFLRLGATVIAAEPDAFNVEILQKRFRKKAVTVIGKAISYEEGSEIFFIEKPGSGKNTLSRKWKDVLEDKNASRLKEPHNFISVATVETTTIGSLIEKFSVPYFIKIDVEGYELNVLKGLKTKVPYISFEINLPEFQDEGMECITLLEKLCGLSKFNYIKENFEEGFKLEKWVDYQEFSKLLQEYDGRYMEVFCKMTEK